MWPLNIVLSLAFHVLLSGSALVPVMLILRWGTVKWRRLHSLASSRNRWLLIWGLYGFIEMALEGALFLWRGYRWNGELTFVPLDFLGWARGIAEIPIYVFHVQMPIWIVFVAGFALKTAGEMATDCGLAVTAWWVYGALTREPTAQLKVERYTISALFSTCVFGIANSPHFWPWHCSDCFARHGVPFIFFHEGGFAGGAGLVWTGALGDTIVVLTAALFLASGWNRLAQKFSGERRRQVPYEKD